LQNLDTQLAEHTSRAQQMRDHLKNVQTEFLNTQFFNNSKRKEVDTEKHMKQVLDREAGRVRVDGEKLQKEIEETQEKVA
jgi:predicted  nucleic acid-binding Zn-ribbon protein